MDTKKKNRLDLEYHSESQQANVFLVLLTTGILAFVGTFLWSLKMIVLYYGAGILAAVSMFGLFFYRKSTKRMKEILKEIDSM